MPLSCDRYVIPRCLFDWLSSLKTNKKFYQIELFQKLYIQNVQLELKEWRLTRHMRDQAIHEFYVQLDLTLGIILSQLVAVVCKLLIQAGRGSLSRLFCLIHDNVVEQSKDTRTMKMWHIVQSHFRLRQSSISTNSNLENELINEKSILS